MRHERALDIAALARKTANSPFEMWTPISNTECSNSPSMF